MIKRTINILKYIGLIMVFCSLDAHCQKTIDDQNIVKVRVSGQHLKTLNEASTLLISCVDFRLREETRSFMDKLDLLEDYDEVSIPGASLALVNDTYPYWGKTIEDIIGVLQKLHNIKQVIFLDHRECGAYKLLMGPEYLETRDKETKTHTDILNKARKLVKQQFPDLKVYTFLMGLDGMVEQIHED